MTNFEDYDLSISKFDFQSVNLTKNMAYKDYKILKQ